MAKINKTTKYIGRVVGDKVTQISWMNSKLMQPLWKSMKKILKNLKIGVPYDFTVSLFGI